MLSLSTSDESMQIENHFIRNYDHKCIIMDLSYQQTAVVL